jgi:hypothetical protein
MKSNEILSRWLAIESGNGLQKARRIARSLSIAALVFCIGIGLAVMRFGPTSLLFAIAGLVVGWLIAERNALDARIANWPTYRQYIDWPRVRKDLQIDSASQDK